MPSLGNERLIREASASDELNCNITQLPSSGEKRVMNEQEYMNYLRENSLSGLQGTVLSLQELCRKIGLNTDPNYKL